MHKAADFKLEDAVNGAKVLFSKISGGTVPNADAFYASIDVLGYAGNYIPSGATPAVAAISEQDQKQALKALADCPISKGMEAPQLNWLGIAKLVASILTMILAGG